MLTVAKMPSASYFATKDGALYYTRGELPGVWFGRGAEARGLVGPIKETDFMKMHDGFAPDGSKLVRNAGMKSHFPGLDATNSAPATVKILWAAQRDQMGRAEIERAMTEANRDALGLYEDTGAFTRLGKGGHIVQQASGIIAGSFLQFENRDNGIHLHVHNCIFTPVLCRDGEFRAMLGITARKNQAHVASRSALFQLKMTLGAAFRESLAQRIEALGYPVERGTDGFFEVVGVPKVLVDKVSTRHKTILQDMQARGVSGAREAARSQLRTKATKQPVAVEELLDRWRPELNGFDPATLRVRPAVQVASSTISVELHASAAAKARAHVLAAPVLREGPVVGPNRNAAAERAKPVTLTPSHDRNSQPRDDERLLRTAALVARLLRHSRSDRGHVLTRANVFLAAKQVEYLQRTKFTPDEQASLLDITRKRGSVQFLGSAAAGQRIEPLLAAARIAYQRQGYRVVLAAHSRIEAERFEQRTGIHSISAAGLLKGLTSRRGLLRGYDAAMKKSFELGLGFRSAGAFINYALKASGPWIRLDSKTVLIVDNPSSLDVSERSDLLKRARRAGAKLVFVDGTREAADIAERLVRSRSEDSDAESYGREHRRGRERSY